MPGVHTKSVKEEDLSMTPQEQQEIVERRYDREDREDREARMHDKAGTNWRILREGTKEGNAKHGDSRLPSA